MSLRSNLQQQVEQRYRQGKGFKNVDREQRVFVETGVIFLLILLLRDVLAGICSVAFYGITEDQKRLRVVCDLSK